MIKEGVRANILSDTINSQGECKAFELEDELSNWHCIRLEFLTIQSYKFKTYMRDMVACSGSIGISTNQPKGVILFSREDTESFFSGLFCDFVQWLEVQGGAGVEI